MQSKCPACQSPFVYDTRYYGKRFKCRGCLRVVEIDGHGSPRLVVLPSSDRPSAPAPTKAKPIKYKCKHCKAILETEAAMGMMEEGCPVCHEANHVPPSALQKQQEKERDKAAQREEKERRRAEEAARRTEALQEHDRQQAMAVPLAPPVADPPPAAIVAAIDSSLPPVTRVAGSPISPPAGVNVSLSPGAFAGNLLWFLFGGGMFLALGWLLLGGIMCLTVIGLPFGMAAFRIAGFAAFPFGKELVDARLLGENRIAGTAIANLLWVLLAGLWLAIGHVLSGVGCLMLFIFVIPVFWGMAHFKLAAASFAPLGKRAVPKAYAQALIQTHAQRQAEAVMVARGSFGDQANLQTPHAALRSAGAQGLALNSRFLPIAIAVGVLLGIGILVLVVRLATKSGANSDLRNSGQSAAGTEHAAGTVSTTDFQATRQRARVLHKEMENELASVQAQNQGNDIALRIALDRVRNESKNRIAKEFSRLQGRTVQWRFTVRAVSLYFGEVWVYLEEPQGGMGLDDGTGLYIRFGEGGWNFIKVGKELPLSFAEKLHPGDPLAIEGTVRVTVDAGAIGPFNMLNRDVLVEILMSNLKVERAN